MLMRGGYCYTICGLQSPITLIYELSSYPLFNYLYRNEVKIQFYLGG